MYPLVLELAADGIAIVVTCRVLGFSTQAFYKWKNNPVSDRDWDDAHLINAAVDIHHQDPAFGYRFIADELADKGYRTSENRVARLCGVQRIRSVINRKRGRATKSGPPVHSDLINGDYTATGPNRKWLTDITEHPTGEGKLYVCVIKDCYSNKIVGYSIDSHMRASLAVSALQNAIALRKPEGTIVHSDRGGQYRSQEYLTTLHEHGLIGSMGRAGAPDNNAMESFNSLLQNNVFDQQHWPTRHELRLAIVSWIEKTYHRKRRQRRLGKHTPTGYETLKSAAHAA